MVQFATRNAGNGSGNGGGVPAAVAVQVRIEKWTVPVGPAMTGLIVSPS